MILETLDKYIDFKLVLLIIVSSYWAKKKLEDVFPRMRIAHKIFIWSTLVTIAYWFFLVKTGVFQAEYWPIYAISYFTATSFYELAFAPLENAVKNTIQKLSPKQS